MLETTVQVNTRYSTAAGGIWSRPYRLLTLGLTLTVVAAAFESLSVATTMPAAVRDLGGLSLYGWAFSAFMLATIVGLTIAGSEADRVGPLRPYLGGVVLFTFGLVLAGFAPSMPVLIAARAVQGLGAGLVGSVAYVAIGRGYPEAARPRMLALVSSAYVLPSLIGPALAGLVADYLGWRWVFLGLAPLLPLAAALAVPALRRFERGSGARRDWGQIGVALRLAAGAGLVTSGLGSSQTLLLTVILTGIGAALVVPAFRRLIPAGAQPGAGLPAALFTTTLLNMAFFGADAFLPLGLTHVRNQPATVAGLALTAATLSWTAASWLQARLASRWSRRVLVASGLVLIAFGIGGAAAVLGLDVPVALAPLAWAIAGLGMGLASPTLALLAFDLAPAGQQGASTSAMQLAGVLGIAFGTGIGGVIVGSGTPGASISPLNIVAHDLLMIVMLAIALWLARGLPSRSSASLS